ncbi:MAG TPA: ketopantoate reductase family protein [Casimicrobiaceae bacterium]|nr:ketopantoate reductase family protein [Casimicrobiaceae bacterium]
MSSPFVPASVAVLGAGAVGSYYGAKLARSGIDVTLVARPVHVAAIERDGLRVVEGGEEWRADVRATTNVGAVSSADVVLVTVKSPDTTASASALARFAPPSARIVSLQNGVDNAERIGAALANPVYACVVYVGVQMDGPGRVRHTGRGDLVIGVPRAFAARGDSEGDLRAIAAMFESAGIPCPIDADVEAALWTKLTLNCAFNAVSALGNSPYGRMVASPSIRGVMEAVVREAVAVARAAGARLDADGLVAATWKLAAAMPDQYSSTAQDVQRGKATEIDALNGFVAWRGAALGVDAPVNRTLHALVKLREQAAQSTGRPSK